MNEKVDFTSPMKILVSGIVILDYLTNTGLIPTTLYSTLMATSIISFYLFFSKKREGFSIYEVITLLLSSSFVVLNRDVSNFSLGLMWIFYFIFMKSKIDGRILLKYYAITASFCFSLSILLYYLIGFNKSSDMLMWRNGEGVTRLSLGFIQPNLTMMTFLGLIITFLYLSNQKRSQILLMILATIIVFDLTKSRTSGYILFLLLGVCFLVGKRIVSKAGRMLKWIVISLPLLLLAISIFMLKYPINESINSLLSGRILLYQSIYYDFGIHLIGNSAVKFTMLDTGYLQALIAKGILFSIFLGISFYYIFFKGRKSKSKLDYIVLAIYFLIAFTETSFFRFIVLLPILIISIIGVDNKGQTSM